MSYGIAKDVETRAVSSVRPSKPVLLATFQCAMAASGLTIEIFGLAKW